MASLTFVTTCMGRLDALRQTLGRAAGQSGSECVLVDYACPQHAGDWAEAHVAGVTVVRVADRTEFNASVARNLGAARARSTWLCFFDADVRLADGFVDSVFPRLAPGGFYRLSSPDGGLGGTFLCERADFERVGGYDEIYRGWGEEDNDLYDALQFAGLQPRMLPGGLAEHIPHDNARRIRHYGDLTLGHAINRVYRIAKWDANRVLRDPMPPAIRQPLYENIVSYVSGWYATGRANDLVIHLPYGIVPGDGSLSRSLSYRLAGRQSTPM